VVCAVLYAVTPGSPPIYTYTNPFVVAVVVVVVVVVAVVVVVFVVLLLLLLFIKYQLKHNIKTKSTFSLWRLYVVKLS